MSKSASVTISVGVVESAVGCGRDLNIRSASAMRARMMFGEMGRGSKTILAELGATDADATGGGVGSIRFSIDCVTERGRVAYLLFTHSGSVTLAGTNEVMATTDRAK